MNPETTITRVSAFGRFADDLTRKSLEPTMFDVRLRNEPVHAQKKSDGYFVFTDLEPSATTYPVGVTATGYQSRGFDVSVPTPSAVEVSFGGEDELFVRVTGVDMPNDRVDFDTPPFVPTIRAGAAVFGEGGFTATLKDDLEGSSVGFAILDNVTGVAQNEALRIVRSPRLTLRAGPYYAFNADATLVAIKVVDNAPDQPPLEGAAITIDQVDGSALGTHNVGGVSLRTATLVSTQVILLGTDRAVQTTSNHRGDAVFYFEPTTAIGNVRIAITRSGFQTPPPSTIAITPGQRVALTVSLNRV